MLAVSVDPANDTPARARRFLNEQRMTGRMRFLLGTSAQLAPVWRASGSRRSAGELDHSAYVVLVDARGRQRVGFPYGQLTPEGLAHDIARLRLCDAGSARRGGGERVLRGVLAVLRGAIGRVGVGPTGAVPAA